MNYQELALRFACRDDALYGIASVPERPASAACWWSSAVPSTGSAAIASSPCWRVRSPRKASPVLRFDYRGMGDSGGDMRDFEQVDDDLRAAIDQFFAAVPALEEVVIWGLCDGASAALFYAEQDPRVSGLVLLNPWARSERAWPRPP